MVILEKLRSLDSAFTYNFCVDKSNKTTGFVWMTLVVRSNLYCIESFISGDFLKRKTNVHLWPYIGHVVIIENPCVIGEFFFLEKQSLAYYFVQKF